MRTNGIGFRTFPEGNFNAVQNWTVFAGTKYLGLAPLGASSQKFTFSVWVKMSTASRNNFIYLQDNAGSGVLAVIAINASNQISLTVDGAGDTYVTTNTFSSTTSWYHIVVAVDTTQATAANRQIIYVNGVSQAATGTTYTLNDNVLANEMLIGGNASNAFFGFLAYLDYVDGQQLTPTSFSTHGAPGVIPSAFAGTYGTNGFLLTFANTAALGTDTSGKGNNFNQHGLVSGDASLQNIFY